MQSKLIVNKKLRIGEMGEIVETWHAVSLRFLWAVAVAEPVEATVTSTGSVTTSATSLRCF